MIYFNKSTYNTVCLLNIPELYNGVIECLILIGWHSYSSSRQVVTALVSYHFTKTHNDTDQANRNNKE